MRRDTSSSGEKTRADRGKIGAGVKPTGVFKRISDAERQSGMKRIIRHTVPDSK
jgi:hypothetical protein